MVRVDPAAWWRSLGSPRFVAAPMVDQSELAFRMTVRKLGAQLCYTPMLHARIFDEVPAYRAQHFDPHPDDRPVFAQFAGHDPGRQRVTRSRPIGRRWSEAWAGARTTRVAATAGTAGRGRAPLPISVV